MSDLPRLLCVDDEPEILASLRVTLRKRYTVTTAESGPAALALFDGADPADPPFDVILSDMRMPEMLGAELLSILRVGFPDMPRLLLSGQADLDSTITAINDAKIFRFLTKPCTTEHLVEAIDDALEQARLIRVERELLDRTLNGTVGLLTEVLGLVSVGAYGRAQRIDSVATALSVALGRPVPWDLALASKLSQLGVVVMQDAADTAAERRQAEVAAELLVNIPRLEPVAWLVRHQHDDAPVGEGPDLSQWSERDISAEILRAAVRFERMTAHGASTTATVRAMAAGPDRPPKVLLDALASVELSGGRMVEAQVAAQQLAAGMQLVGDVETQAGLKLAAAGTTLTSVHIGRIHSFSAHNAMVEPIEVLVPEAMMRVLEPLPMPPRGAAPLVGTSPGPV